MMVRVNSTSSTVLCCNVYAYKYVYMCMCRQLGLYAWKQPDVMAMVGAQASLCDQLPGLSRRQLAKCQETPDHMPAIGRGALIGIRGARPPRTLLPAPPRPAHLPVHILV